MKNLLVYVSKDKKFNRECETLAKIQIDNSLRLKWRKEDILMVTNFDYEYRGVKAIVVGDENYCAVRPRSIKTSIIPHLIEKGIIEKRHIYWNHDFDAFQLHSIKDEELGLDGFDAGFTDYGWKNDWCLGSDFIKESAKDIFEWLRDAIFANWEDEEILGRITRRNTHNINSRIKKMNMTYQIGMKNVDFNYKIAAKPLKVLHFHPHKPGLLDIFMYGKNQTDKPLMPKGLINIFNKHGIK